MKASRVRFEERATFEESAESSAVANDLRSIHLATWEIPSSDVATPVSGLVWSQHVFRLPDRVSNALIREAQTQSL